MGRSLCWSIIREFSILTWRDDISGRNWNEWTKVYGEKSWLYMSVEITSSRIPSGNFTGEMRMNGRTGFTLSLKVNTFLIAVTYNCIGLIKLKWKWTNKSLHFRRRRSRCRWIAQRMVRHYFQGNFQSHVCSVHREPWRPSYVHDKLVVALQSESFVLLQICRPSYRWVFTLLVSLFPVAWRTGKPLGRY